MKRSDVKCRALCSTCGAILAEQTGGSRAKAALWTGFHMKLEEVTRHVAHGHVALAFSRADDRLVSVVP